MSRIDSLIQQHCPNGVEHLPLASVGTFSRGGGPQKKDFTSEGVGCIHYGQIYTHYGIAAETTNVFVPADVAVKSRKADQNDVIIAVTGENDEDLGKAVAWLGEESVAVSNHTLIFTSPHHPKYVSYFLQSSSFHQQKRRHITGTKVRSLSANGVGAVKIPVPPLEVQQEIVRILDKFTRLEAELEAELEARQKQYEHYRNALLEPTSEMTKHTLEEISSRITSGGTPSSKRQEYYGGDIPWLRTQDVDFNRIYSTSASITEEGFANSNVKWVPKHAVIVAMYGATAGKVAVSEIALTTNQACCNLEIDSRRANYRYVFHWIASRYQQLKGLGVGSQSNLNARMVRNFPIYLPSNDEQNRIAELLDNFDSLVTDVVTGLPAEIEARRKQYEYYRDKLLTFKELVA